MGVVNRNVYSVCARPVDGCAGEGRTAVGPLKGPTSAEGELFVAELLTPASCSFTEEREEVLLVAYTAVIASGPSVNSGDRRPSVCITRIFTHMICAVASGHAEVS